MTAMSVSVSGPHVNCKSLSVRVPGSLTRTEVSLVSTPSTLMESTSTVGVGEGRGGRGGSRARGGGGATAATQVHELWVFASQVK